jgi:hypothetical protein
VLMRFRGCTQRRAAAMNRVIFVIISERSLSAPLGHLQGVELFFSKNSMMGPALLPISGDPHRPRPACERRSGPRAGGFPRLSERLQIRVCLLLAAG